MHICDPTVGFGGFGSHDANDVQLPPFRIGIAFLSELPLAV
ncbi:MAG: hypothetical protein ACW967_00985 [Candidatus Hodarchaeales archaeon]